MFQRVLVANRGEVAVRVIRALHELGIEAVAVYSTADAGALHTRLADRAVCIGPPPAAESYLRIPALVGAAEITRCEAVHPGWGFLAENPAFVTACEENGLVFVGPTAETMERMGDKAAARAELAAAGVPTVPGTDRPTSEAEVRDVADELGYPLLLKAVAGGGGKGMRLVTSAAELEGCFRSAAAEADAAFGDPRLYVERCVQPARHVEIQVLCDADGGVMTLGERECSIQRRHQKLVEESPSPAVSAALRDEMEDAAERACRAIRYRNAGTFEFLVGPGGASYFIELNARLQVEHPVTELVSGIDLVREQLRLAQGTRVGQTRRAERRGHAIECRINAEDPRRDFAPAPGRIESFRPPLGPGVRFDTFVEDGAVIPPHYDSLLGKLVVWDEDRSSAIGRALRALAELTVEGVATTRELAIDVLRSEEFSEGRYSTSFLEQTAERLPSLASPVEAR
jgi:acetyl-CoA carboxylase, biotin carboxylase subunit